MLPIQPGELAEQSVLAGLASNDETRIVRSGPGLVEMVLPEGTRLVVEGCCLDSRSGKTRVDRIRLIVGDTVVFES